MKDSIPASLLVGKPRLLNYYRYSSYTYERVYEENEDKLVDGDKEFFDSILNRFLISPYKDEGRLVVAGHRRDNKIVIEVEATSGEIFFIGYKDLSVTIGLKRGGDSWVKPAKILEKPD